MSMLTLNGVVLNVFDTPESTDRKTGEVRPASTRVQLQAENTLENGQKRFDMVTLKVKAGDVYRKLVGKAVRVPVGAFVANGAILYYALNNEAPSAS
jgi:hypothetical protein